ncbi:MAG TPA: hypothetical protein VFJ58_28505 [Armatimonadota bacterium]|nr:hypothetical protein [Armatimonadota bacterium]
MAADAARRDQLLAELWGGLPRFTLAAAQESLEEKMQSALAALRGLLAPRKMETVARNAAAHGHQGRLMSRAFRSASSILLTVSAVTIPRRCVSRVLVSAAIWSVLAR